MTISGEDWRNEYYCINHNFKMEDSKSHTFKLTNRVNYYSNDSSDFKRQIGYLFYLAAMEQNANGQYINRKDVVWEDDIVYIKLNGYGAGASGNYQRTKYQVALWQLLCDFSTNGKSCNSGEAPFYLTKVGKVSDDDWNQTAGSRELYQNVKNNYKNNTGTNAPCFVDLGLDSTELQMDTNSNEVNFRQRRGA